MKSVFLLVVVFALPVLPFTRLVPLISRVDEGILSFLFALRFFFPHSEDDRLLCSAVRLVAFFVAASDFVFGQPVRRRRRFPVLGVFVASQVPG